MPRHPTSAGFPSNLAQVTKYGSDRLDPAGIWLRIGDFPRTTDMARDVAEPIDMANGRSVDKLAHLAWLLIDGNYAIERILRSDPSSTCWISIDLINKKPAAISPGDSLTKFCPRARTIAQNLFHELLDPLGPAGGGLFPTR